MAYSGYIGMYILYYMGQIHCAGRADERPYAYTGPVSPNKHKLRAAVGKERPVGWIFYHQHLSIFSEAVN